MSDKYKVKLRNCLSVITLCALGFTSLVFAILYIDCTGFVFILKNRTFVEVVLTVTVTLLTILTVVFQRDNEQFVIKISVVVFSCIIVLFGLLYLLKISGLDEKLSTFENLKSFILSYDEFTIPAFILLQFLQVVILPIPSLITIGVGVAVFGVFWGVAYSFIGIVTASLTAFYIGRKFGVKAVGWLIGSDNLKKGLKLVEGRDKIVLTLMFLFPFFPDDLLCFVSGVSKISVKYFTVMIIITRFISIIVTALTVSGIILPLNTWWGFTFWLIFFALAVIICIVVYKNPHVKGKKDGKNCSSY